jgi:hypothetical protein
MEITESLVRRFWKYTQKGQPDACWEWNAALRAGYGCLKHMGKVVNCHRLSYLIHHGSIPDGLVVAHKCDNRRCVNPHHLEAITLIQNTIDGCTRGRHKRGVSPVRGSECYNAKLDDDLVRKIREVRKSTGLGSVGIGKHLNISHHAVKQVLANRTWKHVS